VAHLGTEVRWLRDEPARVIEQDAVERAELRRLLAESMRQLPAHNAPQDAAGRAEKPATQSDGTESQTCPHIVSAPLVALLELTICGRLEQG
jgi:hypothetical protein